jgi:hypothetical protein
MLLLTICERVHVYSQYSLGICASVLSPNLLLEALSVTH